jgi:ATP-dependent helicase/nuclease subunit B
MNEEEKLGIYRMMAMPRRDLWISCSATDEEGKDIKPSRIFETLTRLYDILPEKDILSKGKNLDLLASPQSGLRHLTGVLRQGLEGETVEGEWQEALSWYRANQGETLEKLAGGIFHTGKEENLDEQLAEALYQRESGELRLSPSGIEGYSRCPFYYLMNYGIRPEERRIYQVAGREIGDLYHQCLMQISRKLSEGKGPITGENSPWMTIDKEQCYSLVDTIVDQEAALYREGLLVQGPEESYKKERIKNVCRQVAWTLIEHVRQGDIQRVEFEAGFGSGPGAVFPPIPIEAAGKQMTIEGKIDRVDVLKKDRVKIIDYKSGNEKFDLKEVEKGYRLQLMIYLKAVQDVLDPREPGAGVFYFHIDEPLLDASDVSDGKLEEAIEKDRIRRYRLDGMLLDDEEVIRSIAGEFDDYSGICSLRSTKEGIKGTGEGRLLSEDEFRQVRLRVDELLETLCGSLISGKVAASPMKSGRVTACDYCRFKAVCGFDIAFEGCRYRNV